MKLSDTDIERIAEAVCRRLDHRETVREDARYLAGMDTDDLIEHQRNLSRLARRGGEMKVKWRRRLKRWDDRGVGRWMLHF